MLRSSSFIVARYRPIVTSTIRCYLHNERRSIITTNRTFSDRKSSDSNRPSSLLDSSSNEQQSVLDQVLIGGAKSKKPETVVEKAVEGTKNAMLYVFLIAGCAGIIGLVYILYKQFWSALSPTRIYSDAAKIIRADDRCIAVFGSPIAVHGEETSRGRRRHVRSIDYISTTSGTRRVRVMFHLKGPLARGTAYTEIEERKGDTDRYKCRYLYIETDEIPAKTVVLIDNRLDD